MQPYKDFKPLPKTLRSKPDSPKVPWTKDKYEKQLQRVESDIKERQKEINLADSQINKLRNQKQVLAYQISKLDRYRKQLQKDIENIQP